MTTPGGTSSSTPVVIGILADPVAAPASVARQLERDLPHLLAAQLGEPDWRIDVRLEQLPPTDVHEFQMMDFATERLRQHGWDLAVCITDLPMRSAGRPVVADASKAREVAVVSLPAFGAMALRRRVQEVVVWLVAVLRDSTADTAAGHGRAALGQTFRRLAPDQEEVDVRVVASRGRLRLLLGMVRDNRPWRLVAGLRGALVGAFAFSAFYLINPTLWQLATTMTPVQRLAAALGSLAVLVTWLIVYHQLWMRTRGRPAPEREEAMLFNASTVLTLALGLSCGYAALYALNLVAAVVVYTPEVLGQYVGPTPSLPDYALVVLLVTSAATVAGAIGSGFESEESVREAAYSRRERERREALRRSSPNRHRQERGRRSGS
ncbi:hypothetical protein ACL02T_34060 [Pseudonocardia sp. RS010]|uniref:hypothetical protein n=1 Tax=Pseudonocardia sp. RS010 TaxID=3385979 RepID=UPI0039A10704